MQEGLFDNLDPVRNELERKYREWLVTHEHVWLLMERFALQMADRGRRFGMSMLIERVRWEVRTTWALDVDGFKINNNFTAYIARDLIAKYPVLETLIETRRIRGEADDAAA